MEQTTQQSYWWTSGTLPAQVICRRSCLDGSRLAFLFAKEDLGKHREICILSSCHISDLKLVCLIYLFMQSSMPAKIVLIATRYGHCILWNLVWVVPDWSVTHGKSCCLFMENVEVLGASGFLESIIPR